VELIKYGCKVHIVRPPPSEYCRTIIAMHGDGKHSDNRCWIGTLLGLIDHNVELISVSMPGYGQSTGKRSLFRSEGVEVIHELVQSLGLSTIIIMGRSVGGRNSVMYSHQHINMVSHMIL